MNHSQHWVLVVELELAVASLVTYNNDRSDTLPHRNAIQSLTFTNCSRGLFSFSFATFRISSTNLLKAPSKNITKENKTSKKQEERLKQPQWQSKEAQPMFVLSLADVGNHARNPCSTQNASNYTPTRPTQSDQYKWWVYHSHSLPYLFFVKLFRLQIRLVGQHDNGNRIAVGQGDFVVDLIAPL